MHSAGSAAAGQSVNPLQALESFGVLFLKLSTSSGNNNNTLCLAVPANATGTNGATLQAVPCSVEAAAASSDGVLPANMLWHYDPTTGQLKSAASSKCINAADATKPETGLQQWDCTMVSSVYLRNQKFEFNQYGQLKVAGINLCGDFAAAAGSMNQSSPLKLVPCGITKPRWSSVPSSATLPSAAGLFPGLQGFGALATRRAAATGNNTSSVLCLAVPPGNLASNGAIIHATPGCDALSNGTAKVTMANMLWHFDPTTSQIKMRANGKCLNAGDATKTETTLQQWDCVAASSLHIRNQKWVLTAEGKLKVAGANLCAAYAGVASSSTGAIPLKLVACSLTSSDIPWLAVVGEGIAYSGEAQLHPRPAYVSVNPAAARRSAM
jgi:hypothetical protein